MTIRLQRASMLSALAITLALAGWRASEAPDAPSAPSDALTLTARPPTPVYSSPALADAVAFVEADDTVAPALYRPRERLVKLEPGASAAEVAASHGLSVAREPGRSGYALLTGPPDGLSGLSADSRVLASHPQGVTSGSGNVRIFEGQLEPLQSWYIDQVDPPESYGWYGNWVASYPAASFVVAVLDTGVAYETASRDGAAYAAAPSLAASPIVAPWDFVNDDADANDDHQHGTHIASLIAASNRVSELHGIAPEAGIMPIKVLDQNNQGIELDLVEGIWHAVDNGADVINMSLSFSEGYQPSPALREALQAAHDAGIVLIGAAGNDGADFVTWPAASPLVMAIGSSAVAPNQVGDFEMQGPASYTNLSAGIDLMVIGGDLSRQFADSTLPADGLLAEAIAPDDPTRVGYWLMAGTSQAAAVASGIAVTMLQDGVPPEQIPSVFQLNARHGEQMSTAATRRTSQRASTGAGYLDMHWGYNLADSLPYQTLPSFHVALLPYLERVQEGIVRPAARVTVFDANGAPAAGHEVLAQRYGTDTGIVGCTTDPAGQCRLLGSEAPELDEAGNRRDVAVLFSVEKVLDGLAIGHAPSGAITATPELQELIAQIRANPDTASAMLAWAFAEGEDAALGPVAPAISLVDSGSGLKSLPLGLVLDPDELDDLGDSSPAPIESGGTQLSARLFTMDGSGLKSLPLGIADVTILAIDTTVATTDGTGLKSLPLGVRPGDQLGDGEDVVPLGETGGTSSMAGTPIGDQLAEGGWSLGGYGIVTALSSSSHLAIAPTFIEGLNGEGHGAMMLDLP